MNIFIIPSWYPSPQHPYTGIFFRDQAETYARQFPEDTIGISHWGQNDERFLLWSKDRFEIVRKTVKGKKVNSSIEKYSDNFYEYFYPAFTWTRKFYKGNVKGVLKANAENLNQFEIQFGEVDIFIAHVGFPAGYIAMELAKKKGKPYVIIEHMTPFPFRDYRRRANRMIPLLWKAYQSADGIISVSENLRDEISFYGINNVKVQPNYISDEEFGPGNIPAGRNHLKIVSIGRLVTQKGFDILIEALPDLSINQYKLIIIGDGVEEQTLKELAEKKGVAEKVEWKGSLTKNEIVSELQNADLFVLASRHESFGIVFLEALACGVPCIGTYCGGPEEIVSEEVGIIIDKENPETLSEAMNYMIQNLDKYPSEKVRDYFERYFSTKKLVTKQRKYFKKVIKNHLMLSSSSSEG